MQFKSAIKFGSMILIPNCLIQILTVSISNLNFIFEVYFIKCSRNLQIKANWSLEFSKLDSDIGLK